MYTSNCYVSLIISIFNKYYNLFGCRFYIFLQYGSNLIKSTLKTYSFTAARSSETDSKSLYLQSIDTIVWFALPLPEAKRLKSSIYAGLGRFLFLSALPLFRVFQPLNNKIQPYFHINGCTKGCSKNNG